MHFVYVKFAIKRNERDYKCWLVDVVVALKGLVETREKCVAYAYRELSFNYMACSGRLFDLKHFLSARDDINAINIREKNESVNERRFFV